MIVESRSALPEELATMAPGPALAQLLASVDRAGLECDDLLRLAQARSRLVAHQQAALLADLYAVAHTTPDRGSQPGRREPAGKYRWAEVDVAFALAWTTSKAGAELEFSDELVERLPRVFQALSAGRIDRPKAFVIASAVAPLDEPVARAVVERVIEQAPRLTTGQLAARLRRLVIAADPAAADRRARQEVKGRRVQAFATEAGLAALCGYELAPHRVAAAMERMTAIARAAKSAGDPRRLDQLRADILLDLLVGEGIAGGGPITDGDLAPPAPPAEPVAPTPEAPTPEAPTPEAPTQAAVSTGAPTHRAVSTGAATDSAAAWPAAPVDPDLSLPDPPPVLPGWNACGEQAPPALTEEQPPPAFGDESIDPEQEQLRQLWYTGFDQLPRDRPVPATAPGSSSDHGAAALPGPRRGVVDIQVPLTTLLGLTELPAELTGWGPVIADIARRVVAEHPDATWRYSVYDRLGELTSHGITPARPAPGRRPTAADAAFVKARDRTCRAPGCRRAARHCDIDHTVDWAYSNDSRRCNLACLCRKHHRFKHSTGAELLQLSPGVLGWLTPAGLRYVTNPEPYPSELEPPELAALAPT